MKLRRTIALTLVLMMLIGYSPLTPGAQAAVLYSIGVDLTNQIVTVYSLADGSIVRQFICSTGAPGTSTPKGTFSMPTKRKSKERTIWYQLLGAYGHYASRIHEGVMFHSYLYNRPSESSLDVDSVNLLGVPVSHGCIRLEIPDAKWIAENCPAGTKVRIYESNSRTDYLKKLLYRNTFSVDNGISYTQFVGGSLTDDELGYMSEGQHVRSLQGRLLGLGLYGGVVSGVYDDEMVQLVESIQSALGLEVTGRVNKGLWTLLFSDDAPTCDLADLSVGANGPVVLYSQALLKKLGLYDGQLDGVFDADMDSAVRKFQRYLEIEADGVITLELRDEMEATIRTLSVQYPAGYMLDSVPLERSMATIATADSIRLNVRKTASKTADSLGQLKSGTKVEVLETEGKWSLIKYQGSEGYVLNQYIDAYTERTSIYDYFEVEDPELVAFDPADYAFTPFFSVKVAEVAQGSKSENMLFYKKPATPAKVAFALLEKSHVDVVEVNGKWTLATYCGVEGYILTSALTMGEISSLYVDESVGDSDNPLLARNLSGSAVNVYSNVSVNSDLIGTLDAGEQAEVTKQGETWSEISYAGGVGYIENSSVVVGSLSERLESYLLSVSHHLSATGPIDGTSTTPGRSELAADIAESDVIDEVDLEADAADGLDE